MRVETITVNTILYCRNWIRTVEFYRDRLGFRETFANDWFVEFHLGGSASLSVANEEQSTMTSAEGEGITVSIEVADLSVACDDLLQAGVEPTDVRRIWGSSSVFVFDPEGNRLEFLSRGQL